MGIDVVDTVLLIRCLFFFIWNLSIQSKYFQIPTPGLEVNFLVHLHSFASTRFFSASKLVIPQANSFPLNSKRIISKIDISRPPETHL